MPAPRGKPPPKKGAKKGKAVPVMARRLLQLDDIDTTKVVTIESTTPPIDVPRITEERMNEILYGKAYVTPSSPQKAFPGPPSDTQPDQSDATAPPVAALLSQPKPSTAAAPRTSPRPHSAERHTRLTPLTSLAHTAPIRHLHKADEFLLHIRAYYRKVHSNGLRVHEELSRNLSVNLGEIVFLEQAVSAKVYRRRPALKDVIPPLSVLVVWLFTTDPDDVVKNLHKDLVVDSVVEGLQRSSRLSRIGSKILSKTRRVNVGQLKDNICAFKNIWTALHSGHEETLARWIGVITLLIGTVAALAKIPPEPSDAQPTVLRQNFTGMTGQEVFRNLKLAANEPNPPTGFVVPPLVCLTSERLPSSTAIRVEGYVEPPPEPEGSPAKPLVQKLEGWAIPSAEEGANFTLQVEVRITSPTQYADLTPFTDYNGAREYVLVPYHPLKAVDLAVADYKVVAAHSDSINSPYVHDFWSMCSGAVNEAFKASRISTRIADRLKSNFVEPYHCHRHQTELMTHFCVVDRAFVCPSCRNEIHLGHDTIPIAAFCHDEVRRLEPRRIEYDGRIQSLDALLHGLGDAEAALHLAVDNEIDGMLKQLEVKERDLHDDVKQRAHDQSAELDREFQLCMLDVQRLEAAKGEVAAIQRGIVNTSVKVKLHRPTQIKHRMLLRLPTQNVLGMVSMLDWSNPAKFLSPSVYPPKLQHTVGASALLSVSMFSAASGSNVVNSSKLSAC